MENYKDDAMQVVVEKSGTTIHIRWKGRSNSRDPSALLDPYFDKLVGDIGGSVNVTVDFTGLEFMNSSTVHPIIKLIKNLGGKQINTRLLYRADSDWQKASFKALNTLSSILSHLIIEGV